MMQNWKRMYKFNTEISVSTILILAKYAKIINIIIIIIIIIVISCISFMYCAVPVIDFCLSVLVFFLSSFGLLVVFLSLCCFCN